jgi:hypothetical protein
MSRSTVVVSAPVLALVAWAFYGCSSQPAAPTALPAVSSATDAASSGPGAGASVMATSARGGRPASLGVVYVTGQGLYYDTFVTVERLPMHGRFQLLANGQTEFGPGDPGYLGGRWWVDVNGNGTQDEGDDFLLCPLLPPGRPTP